MRGGDESGAGGEGSQGGRGTGVRGNLSGGRGEEGSAGQEGYHPRPLSRSDRPHPVAPSLAVTTLTPLAIVLPLPLGPCSAVATLTSLPSLAVTALTPLTPSPARGGRGGVTLTPNPLSRNARERGLGVRGAKAQEGVGSVRGADESGVGGEGNKGGSGGWRARERCGHGAEESPRARG